MSVLPPAAKLPLAVRKNLRDDYENNKADLEKQLTEVLGAPWTIELDPLAIWPYANDGYAKERLGSCIKAYVDGAIYKLKYWLGTHGEQGKNEINTLCTAHVLTLEVDAEKRFSYTGVDVHEGKMRLLFAFNNLGTNVDNALDVLEKALNDAPQPAGADGSAPKLSSAARLGIKQNYEPKIEAVTKKIAEMFAVPGFKLNPRFEENYAILKANAKSASLSEDWDKRMGGTFVSYFEGAEYILKYQKFGEDDMLQEGFNEAVEKGEIAIRIVDKLNAGSYNESVIEDGVLYLQSTPKTWDVNLDQAASKVIDLL